MLFLAGKGLVSSFLDFVVQLINRGTCRDGNIRYYEYEADDLFHLSVPPITLRYPFLTDYNDCRAEYSSPSPQRGMAFLPPRALNVAENEIARAFKCVGSTVEPISFVVPRKVRLSFLSPSLLSLPPLPISLSRKRKLTRIRCKIVRIIPSRPLPTRFIQHCRPLLDRMVRR